MNDAIISEKVKAFLEKDLRGGSSDLTINDDDSLIDQGIIDSLGLFKLVSFLEEEFEIAIDPNEVRGDNFETLAAVVDFIKKKLPTSSASSS